MALFASYAIGNQNYSTADGRNVESILFLTNIYGSLWYHLWPYMLFSLLNQKQIAKFVISRSVNEFWDCENNLITIYDKLMK